jgi:hypothetical protein
MVRNKCDHFNFRTSFSLQLNNFIRDDITSKNLRVLGWLCYIKLDELFDPARKHVDENGCLKFIAKVNSHIKNLT